MKKPFKSVTDFEISLTCFYSSMKNLSYLLGVLLWVGGIAVTPGFWPAFGAVVFPPFAYYNLVRQAMVVYSPDLLP
jgi:hypothetical protein